MVVSLCSKSKQMKATVEYQRTYDFTSVIEYLEEVNPGEYMFKITRRETESFWDPEEDECIALVGKNESGFDVDFEGYSTYPNEEEGAAIYNILKQMNII